MSIIVASLHIHPIKSLGGYSVSEAQVTDRGFAHDRRWMLVDANGRFLTQREFPTMACLHCSPTDTGLRVTDIRDDDQVDLPFELNGGTSARAQVWEDEVDVIHAAMETSTWFTEKFGATCSLVFMPDKTRRSVDPRYANGITSLSDGYPYLILSQASLDDLNARGATWAHGHMSEWAHVPMDRFRPNIVLAGGTAFQEDAWKEVTIGAARFALVKPCGRCTITTTDQRTGERGKEPLRTLATYRRRPGSDGETKVDFGMNAMSLSGNVVRVGDLVQV